MGLELIQRKKENETPHIDLIKKYGTDLIRNLDKVDAKELSWGSDKTLWKRDKLSSYNVFSNPRLKYYKVYSNDRLCVNFCLDEMDKTAAKLGAVYISLDEYFEIRYGKKFVQELKSEMKDFKVAKMREELRLIRNTREIEEKLLNDKSTQLIINSLT